MVDFTTITEGMSIIKDKGLESVPFWQKAGAFILSNPIIFFGLLLGIGLLFAYASHMYDIWEGNARHRGLKGFLFFAFVLMIFGLYYFMYVTGHIPSFEEILTR